ncbi:MAG: peptidyl-prolyl cis-trans isomerase [Magnetococcus sp. WYHC-3]
MVMTALRQGAAGGILKYFLLGILCMATGGLVFMDIGGFFRGGVGSSDVAKVGKHAIPIVAFDQTVRQMTGRLGLTPTQAYQVGYMKELLNSQITDMLIRQRAEDLGIRVGNKEVAANIQKILMPMARPGQSARDVLQQLLSSQGMAEQQLAVSIRQEMTSSALTGALQSSLINPSAAMISDLARYAGETRSVRYIVFKDTNYQGVTPPTDEQLAEFYEKTKSGFAIPEQRKGHLILIKSDAVKDSLEITDEEVAEVYQRNIASYSDPEKRKIEQVILSDADKADAVARLVKDGKPLKDAVQEIAGNTTDYLPARATEKSELPEALQEDIFKAAEKDVIGPLESGLGHHVAVINSITPPRTTPLENVAADIRKDLRENRLLDAQYELANTLDDALASGSTAETLVKELPVELVAIPYTNGLGVDENGNGVFDKTFESDETALITALFEHAEGEASPVMELSQGRMGAVLVESILPESYPPFAEMKDDLAKRWISDAMRVQNKMRVIDLVARAQAEGQDITTVAAAENLPVNTLSDLKRSDKPQAPFTPQAMENIFSTPAHDLLSLDLQDASGIAVVDEIALPQKPADQVVEDTKAGLGKTFTQEGLRLYVDALQDDYGVRINSALLEKAYGTPQDEQ